MKCPRCGERTKTYQTRTRPDGRVFRRRICRRAKCAKKFKTVEQLVPSGGAYVPTGARAAGGLNQPTPPTQVCRASREVG